MNRRLKKILKYSILYPFVVIRHYFDDKLKERDPEKWFSLMHKRSTGSYLNIDDTKTLDDKIAYMAFRTDTSEWSRLADKVRVRDYVKDCGYNESLTKLYGIWDDAYKIDFDTLPNSFVIKTNNGSATNILVKNKANENLDKIRKQLDKWLKYDYGRNTCQPHYSKMKPLILAEEFLVDEETKKAGKVLNDYKFYCVHGRPLYVFVYTDRVPNSHEMKRVIYDMNWGIHPEFLGRYAVPGSEIEKPSSFELMKEMAAKISSPFPFVRVDFYEVNGKPVFGEMTFTPGMQEASNSLLNILGKEVKLF